MARASGIGRNGLLLIPELCLDTAKVGKKRQCSAQSESKTEKLDITTRASSNVTTQIIGRQQ